MGNTQRSVFELMFCDIFEAARKAFERNSLQGIKVFEQRARGITNEKEKRDYYKKLCLEQESKMVIIMLYFRDLIEDKFGIGYIFDVDFRIGVSTIPLDNIAPNGRSEKGENPKEWVLAMLHVAVSNLILSNTEEVWYIAYNADKGLLKMVADDLAIGEFNYTTGEVSINYRSACPEIIY